jgi:hypothetical protein
VHFDKEILFPQKKLPTHYKQLARILQLIFLEVLLAKDLRGIL